MIATQHTQSLTDFRQNAAETLERLNRTGESEIITVNGEARAVLLSPAVYDAWARELELAHDVEVMRRSLQQIANGEGMEIGEFSKELRGRLMTMKAEQPRNKA